MFEMVGSGCEFRFTFLAIWLFTSCPSEIQYQYLHEIESCLGLIKKLLSIFRYHDV